MKSGTANVKSYSTYENWNRFPTIGRGERVQA
jgi:hypothetical protein